VGQLRNHLGDNSTDKFEFKAQAYPAPDGTTKAFHCGDTRLVASSVKVYVDGILKVLTTDYTLDAMKGVVEFVAAPAPESDIHISYHFQWFGDDHLEDFLLAGANTLGVDTVGSDSLPVMLRSAVLHFAAYFAYMKKAAETADSLVAAAVGYQVDQSKSFPNWKRLAENAWAQGKAAIDFYNENPLNAGGIGIKITSYRLPNYVPTS